MTTVTTIEELNQYIDVNFHVSIPLEPKKQSAHDYVFDMPKQEGRDIVPVLVDRMKREFDLLKTMGATDIRMVKAPEIIAVGGTDILRIRTRFLAMDKTYSSLRTGYEYTEGDEITPMKPETKPAPVAIAGYDLVEDKDDAILLCSRIIHATVEAMNKAHNEHTLSWEQSRDSVIAGVKRHLENPNETPAENHAAWMAYRQKEGWVYGPIKDSEKKTHPCMVPYEALGPYQQSKDAVFMAIVDTFFGL